MEELSVEEAGALLQLHGNRDARAVLRTTTGLRTMPRMPLNKLVSKIKTNMADVRSVSLQVIGAGNDGEDLHIMNLSSVTLKDATTGPGAYALQ